MVIGGVRGIWWIRGEMWWVNVEYMDVGYMGRFGGYVGRNMVRYVGRYDEGHPLSPSPCTTVFL